MGLTGHIRLLFYMLCAIRIGHAAAEFQPFRPSALLSTGSAAGRVPELTSA